MLKTAVKTFIRVPKDEYHQLKQLQKRFGQFLNYAEHMSDIRKARRDIKAGRTISQEKLFKKLGITAWRSGMPKGHKTI